MPTFSAAADTIRSRFITQYHASRSEPIAFDNARQLLKQDSTFITEPEDSNGQPINWVRLSIRPGGAFQASSGKSGSRVFRHPGAIIVNVFTVSGSGDGVIYAMGDSVADSLRGITVSGVRFMSPSPPQYIQETGAWYQTKIVTNFEFDLIA